MAFNFPNAPTEGTLFTDATSGAQYIYTNAVWMQSSAAQINLGALPRNRIVNPAMQISQENGNTAGTTQAYYPADQWYHGHSSSGTFTSQRVQVVTPNGSKDRYRETITVADAALAAGDFHYLATWIEGIRVADFRWGTAQAKQVILRFGFKAPAGTYSIRLLNNAGNRSYIANFTISAGQANTDTEQIIVIPGDITGVWLTDNSSGVHLSVIIAVGTTFQGVLGWQAGNFYGTAANTNGMATAGNVFELFDVGLYLDPQATGAAPPWQMPDEAQELAACQRYYWKSSGGPIQFGGYSNAAGGAWYNTLYYPAIMRIAPALSGAAVVTNNVGSLNLATVADTGRARWHFTNTAIGSFQYATDVTANARM